jgi:divalent metal cation (Fe/Co/Zn/Cd) transporter
VAHAAAVPHVLAVSQVCVRQSGPQIFADVVLEVERGLSIERAHEIAHAAEDAIRGSVPGVDVVVHAEPAAIVAGGAPLAGGA